MAPTEEKITHLARRVVLLIAVIIIVTITCLSQTKVEPEKSSALSKQYCNPRFGFCVRYPASLRMDPPPENDDGRRFDNGNGLIVTASGINNSLNDTLKSEMNSASDGFDRITYRAKGTNWFVLSGLKGDKVIYLKTFVGPGSVNHLEIDYAVHLKATYDSVAGNIARSFKPGQLGVSH